MTTTATVWTMQEPGWYTSDLGGILWEPTGWYVWPATDERRLGPYKNLDEAQTAAEVKAWMDNRLPSGPLRDELERHRRQLLGTALVGTANAGMANREGWTEQGARAEAWRRVASAGGNEGHAPTRADAKAQEGSE